MFLIYLILFVASMLSDISVIIASSHAADGVVEYAMQLASELENKAFLEGTLLPRAKT